jgi:MerR family transcriptional regulator, heat shock protein HspR
MAGRKNAGYMISAVAEMYSVHPQTLRLYEREGLLRPSRSEGNTRLYTKEDLQRLELILNLTRDLGVNLAGVEIILSMRERIEILQQEVAEMIQYVQNRIQTDLRTSSETQKALVRIPPSKVVKVKPEA